MTGGAPGGGAEGARPIAARVEVLPGTGTVLRRGGVVVWVTSGASAALLEFLDTSARNLAPSARGGQLLADHVGGVLARHDPEPSAAFATIGPDGRGGATALLHGAAQLFDGTAWRRPPSAWAWSRIDVPLGRPVLALGLGAAPQVAGSHPLLDLEAGVVPGGGFVLVPAPERATPAPAAPPPATPPPAAPPPATPPPATQPPAVAIAGGVGHLPRPETPPGDEGARPAGVVALLPPPMAPAAPTPSTGRPVVPVVRGVRCPTGHFCHPSCGTCPRCGVAVTDDRVVSGPRPPLGVLVADDGSIWPLDAAYLLGADPGADPTVTGGTARPLRLPGERVEPVHAELRPSEWQLALTDRATSSGTFVRGPHDDDWQRLERHRTVTLTPGSHVAIGERVVSYLSPWPA